jgi:hypothetical protein
MHVPQLDSILLEVLAYHVKIQLVLVKVLALQMDSILHPVHVFNAQKELHNVLAQL